MSTFFSIILSFPTVIFTVLLGVAVVYWLVCLLGIADMDGLDGDTGGALDFGGLMATLGFKGVPLPLILTLLFLFAWLTSYFADLLLGMGQAALWLRLLFGLLAIPLSLVVAVAATRVVIHPVRPLFQQVYQQPLQKRLLGTSCIIRSASVSRERGRADAHLADGSHVILQVRSDDTLPRNSRAVLIEYLPDENAYWVVPEAVFLAGHTG